MADRKLTIVGIGEVLWDIYREKKYLGGAPANVAIHTSHLGEQGVIVSRIGNDGLGNELVRAVERKDLTAKYLQIDKKKGTGTVIIRLDVRGVPSFICNEDVAFDRLQFTPALKDLAQTADAVVFGTLAQRSKVSRSAILQFLENSKGVRVFDLNARTAGKAFEGIVKNALQLTDILKVSEDEMQLVMKVFRREGERVINFARWLITAFELKFVALTRGANGAAVMTKNETLTAPAYQIRVVDTTGAGDAFTAGMLNKFLHGAPPVEILEFANKMAACVCLHRGATPNLSQAAVEKFIQNIESIEK
jgi:fructokinase